MEIHRQIEKNSCTEYTGIDLESYQTLFMIYLELLIIWRAYM